MFKLTEHDFPKWTPEGSRRAYEACGQLAHLGRVRKRAGSASIIVFSIYCNIMFFHGGFSTFQNEIYYILMQIYIIPRRKSIFLNTTGGAEVPAYAKLLSKLTGSHDTYRSLFREAVTDLGSLHRRLLNTPRLLHVSGEEEG